MISPITFGRVENPCADCDGDLCTMNCSGRARAASSSGGSSHNRPSSQDTHPTTNPTVSKRAQELARLWFGNDPALAKPVVVRELASLMEQYGGDVREAAAKHADGFKHGEPADFVAKAIREMDLP